MPYGNTRPLVSYDPRAQATRERLALRGLVQEPYRGLPTWACVALALVGFACGVVATAFLINGV